MLQFDLAFAQRPQPHSVSAPQKVNRTIHRKLSKKHGARCQHNIPEGSHGSLEIDNKPPGLQTGSAVRDVPSISWAHCWTERKTRFRSEMTNINVEPMMLRLVHRVGYRSGKHFRLSLSLSLCRSARSPGRRGPGATR